MLCGVLSDVGIEGFEGSEGTKQMAEERAGTIYLKEPFIWELIRTT
jgi:hypothetical protein